jgi:hypothetical protein
MSEATDIDVAIELHNEYPADAPAWADHVGLDAVVGRHDGFV